ncbi:MAG: hypothetical protein JO314_01820, partial [Acidobacteria bacterium]|nr:hypothetical protein [Acidobacteriota bacterium]
LMANAAANTIRGESLYATNIVNPMRTQPGPPSPVEVRTMLGQILMTYGGQYISNELAHAVVDRIGEIDKQDPELGQAYRSVVMRWSNAAINILFLHDAKRGTATTDTLLRLLATREELKKTQPSDIFDMQTGVPSAVGIAACMLEDKNDYASILDSGSPETKTALLACARLIRAPLDVAKVAADLHAKETLLADAAEEYLISEDSPAARAAVLAKHPGEATILGARFNFPGLTSGGGDYFAAGPRAWLYAIFYSVGATGDPSSTPTSYADTNDRSYKTERTLQEEIRHDDSLIGIYAFKENYVRIYRDKVIFSWDDDESRYYQRPLSTEEFSELTSYLSTKRADEQPPYLYCQSVYCGGNELLMLGRNGGRRVYLAGVPTRKNEADFFAGLDKYFDKLRETPAALKYGLSRELPGLEIAFADKDLHAETVWKNGDDLRVAVKSLAVRQKVMDDLNKIKRDPDEPDQPPDDDGPSPTDTKIAKLTAETEFEGYSWHRVVGGADSGIVPQPNDVELIPFRDGMPAQPTQEQWKARAAGFEIRSGDDGLYRIANGTATLLEKGDFETPVVTPNGRWVIVRRSENEDDGTQLVRYDLARKKAIPVTLREDQYAEYEPVTYIPAINRVLLADRRDYVRESEYTQRDDSVVKDDEPASLALLDPDTGAISDARGEFRPLSQQTFRPLQRTSAANSFWAAMPDHKAGSTAVGVYDGRAFTFRPLLTVPKILFNSMDMWVDESGQKLYFVYRGHLLALPMKTDVPPPT